MLFFLKSYCGDPCEDRGESGNRNGGRDRGVYGWRGQGRACAGERILCNTALVQYCRGSKAPVRVPALLMRLIMSVRGIEED